MVRISEYLNNTRDSSITYERSSSEGLMAYVDVDCANSGGKRYVTQGDLMFGGAIVVGVSRTWGNVSLSTSMAKYVPVVRAGTSQTNLTGCGGEANYGF